MPPCSCRRAHAAAPHYICRPEWAPLAGSANQPAAVGGKPGGAALPPTELELEKLLQAMSIEDSLQPFMKTAHLFLPFMPIHDVVEKARLSNP